MYLYTLYTFYSDYMFSTWSGYCETVLNCMVSMFDLSFKNNGGIGSYLQGNVANILYPSASYSNVDFSVERMVYDNLMSWIVFIIIV